MADIRPYRLTILLRPQSSGAEQEAVESLVKNWAREHQGEVRKMTVGEKQKLAYAIAHQSQATTIQAAVSAPADAVPELIHQLGRESKVLRARVFRGEAPSGKHIREIPVKKAEPTRKGPTAKEKKIVKEKAPIEKLEEKIEEILEEKVL